MVLRGLGEAAGGAGLKPMVRAAGLGPVLCGHLTQMAHEDRAVRCVGANGAIAVIVVTLCGMSPRLQALKSAQKHLANALNAISKRIRHLG